MKIERRQFLQLAAGATALSSMPRIAQAQNYPTRTVTLIVPFPAGGGVDTDLVGGHVPISFGVLPPAIGNIQAGTLRAIAVTGPKRFSLLPDVPTADESGLPGFDSVLHYGLLGPANMPPAIVNMLNAELRKIVESDAAKQRIQQEGGDPLSSSPEEYAKDIDQEERKWSVLIRKLNLKVE